MSRAVNRTAPASERRCRADGATGAGWSAWGRSARRVFGAVLGGDDQQGGPVASARLLLADGGSAGVEEEEEEEEEEGSRSWCCMCSLVPLTPASHCRRGWGLGSIGSRRWLRCPALWPGSLLMISGWRRSGDPSAQIGVWLETPHALTELVNPGEIPTFEPVLEAIARQRKREER